jgi:UDP-3-O-[3-hydroxymyristoyl] N-acetylglucosamine deacetylase
MRLRQTTLAGPVSLDGVGIHSNAPARLTLHPADAGAGIVLHRTGLPRDTDRFIDARWSNVTSTELCTRLGSPGCGSIATVEHVMAALAGMGIDNAIVEVDGPEAPILDGSAAPFVEAIEAAGIVEQSRARRFIEILAPVRVSRGRAFAELRPASQDLSRPQGLSLDVEIDFADAAIGRQRRRLRVDPTTFRHELARARTFGFVADVERLWRAGFARGASLDNTVAIADGAVLNAGGLRFPDECVRHKMLDVLGDLMLAGAPLLGAYRSFCGGHTLNHAVLAALFATPAAWRMVEPARGPARAPVAADNHPV